MPLVVRCVIWRRATHEVWYSLVPEAYPQIGLYFQSYFDNLNVVGAFVAEGLPSEALGLLLGSHRFERLVNNIKLGVIL